MIQLNEIFSRQGGHDFKILGTDISEACVETAKNGLYSQYEVQRGLPTKLLSKYFQQEDTSWRLQDEYKKHLTFMWENLLMPERKLMKFDLVLCRNVTIYMDPPKVRNIYEKIHASMNTGGWLLIGHSERMTDHADLFEFVKTDSGIAYRSK
jgi:chemotaxis protein methyltransferase CheR